MDVVDVRIDDFDTVIDSPHSDDMIPYDPDAPSPIPSPLTPSSPVTQDKALPLPGSSSTVTRAYGPGKYLGVTTTTRVRSGSLGAHGREQMPLVVASGRVGEIWARGAQLGEQVGRVVVEDAQVCFDHAYTINVGLLTTSPVRITEGWPHIPPNMGTRARNHLRS